MTSLSSSLTENESLSTTPSPSSAPNKSSHKRKHHDSPSMPQNSHESEERIIYTPLCHIHSPFIRRNGCPRQSLLTTHTLAYMDFPHQSYLDGIETYSHLWIIFHFHENRASHKRMTKIRPPRLHGAKVGIYASRAPHRVNDIGLSLVRLDRVEGKRLYVSGVDLLHGTPVLDVKPYVPYADAPVGVAQWVQERDTVRKSLGEIQSDLEKVIQESKKDDSSETLASMQKKVQALLTSLDSHPVEQSQCPSWVSQPQSKLERIIIPDECIEIISKYASQLEIYKDISTESLVEAITEILMTDPRSVYRKEKCLDQIWWVHFDRLVFTLRMESDAEMRVVQVEYCTGDYMNPDRFLTPEEREAKYGKVEQLSDSPAPDNTQ